MHKVYILHSKALDKFYIGYTANLNIRLDFHLNKLEIRKFTAKADDWTIFFTLECSSKNQALLVEKHIKNMKSTKYIHNLVKYSEISEKLLIKYC